MINNLFSYLFPKKIAEIKDGNSTLFIIEKGDYKIFKYNDIVYSEINKNSVYTRQYWDYFIPAAYIQKNPRILLIGLGGGTIAYELDCLLKNDMHLEIVEANEKIADIAGMLIPGGIKEKVNVEKGEEFIKTKKNAYDAIFLDAYVENKIPAVFLNEDFVDNAYGALSESGILAINFAVGMMGADSFYAYAAKLGKRFKVYGAKTAMNEGNVIMICSKRLAKEEISARIRQNMQENKDNKNLIQSYEQMKEV